MSDASDIREREALLDLIQLRRPISEALGNLPDADWAKEADPPLATLTSEDAIRVLDEYLRGRADGDDLARWADALELHPRVASTRELQQLLFELATPLVNGPVSRETATEWIRRLQGVQT